ncbi:MAG: response regulator transcription factor [Caldilineaceae bacterium]
MKILIVDDHILFREGIASLFAGQPDLTVIGQASCVQEAVTMAHELRPDLILMDFTMPDGTGLDATKAILQTQPGAKILFLTVHENDEMLFEAIRLGAVGYLLKNVSVTQMLKQIRSIEQGEAALMPGMTRKILNEFARRSETRQQGPAELQTLSVRELEVLEELAGGASNREIAQRLYISENTVRNHVHSILTKLKLQNRTQLVGLTTRQ